MVAVSSALEVKVDQVVAGNEVVVSDGSVLVELPHFDRAACPAVPGAHEDADGKLVSVWESFAAMPPAWHGLDSVDEVLAELR